MTDPITASISHISAIHQQMRIDTTRYVVAVETATEADRTGRLAPLAKWASGFGHELHLHHTVEDTYFFPELTARVPEIGAVLADLEQDHQVVDGILQRWTPASRNLIDPAVDFAGARSGVLELAVELRDLLAPHLDTEDDHIMPRIADAFDLEEFTQFDAAIKKSLPKKGLGFAVPWNVEAVPVAERDELMRSAPFVLRMLYRVHAGRFRRLVEAAFDGVPVPEGRRVVPVA